ncbi:Uncharacterised protein [Staphylococcus aureus]|nr:Uncharacterised protein [Staphylococcus aureus]
MYEYESKYPNPNDFQCPPKEANFAEGITFHKCSDTYELPSQYMEPMIEKGSRFPKNNEERCLMCGHSVFVDDKDIFELINKKGRIAKGIKDKWRFVFYFEGSQFSKYKFTPSKSNKKHYTYWHYGSNDIIYSYKSAINE